ncbi:PPIC-type PPIASE domain protein [Opisthorchis viverrini]|uniref:Peptidyl-prolyl cis-trans isomerase n=1 Tax=Opisthorchis viverrini TaxID=6198 RepID=A0A1S8WQF3_OPIVI|nr:PPIC-type PPIASE domain protein [Opisthorchis viverrini]
MNLPAGWISKVSGSTGEFSLMLFSTILGKTYYVNTETQESQWEFPTHPASSSDKVRCLHLLVKHSGSRRPSSWREAKITRSKEDALKLIQNYKKRIESGEISFEELARTESDCSSASSGGDLGFFSRGQMQKPFEEAAFNLKLDEMCGPVYTDSGIHIIKRIA